MVTIALQPATDSFNAAYRPIMFRVNATSSPDGLPTDLTPIGFADVYINNVYYKTLYKTQGIPVNFGGLMIMIYEFDIQSALQEYLSSTLPTFTNLVQVNNSTICECFVRFRNGYLDTDGITQQTGAIPVQATEFTAAVGGGGTQSSTFHVTNSTIQHEANQILFDHYKFYSPLYAFGNNLIATHQPATKTICKGHFDWLAVIHTTIPTGVNIYLSLDYTLRDGTTVLLPPLAQAATTAAYDSLYLPTGYEQMKAIFPAVPWDVVGSYTIAYAAPFYELGRQSYNVMACKDQSLQLTFMNYLGKFDTISFCDKAEFYSAKSEKWQQPLFYGTFFELDQNQGGVNRLNIAANKKIAVKTSCYTDQDKDWIKEIIDTPKAFVLLPAYEDQEDLMIPYFIADASDVQLVKRKERWCYEYNFTLIPANSTIRQRN